MPTSTQPSLPFPFSHRHHRSVCLSKGTCKNVNLSLGGFPRATVWILLLVIITFQEIFYSALYCFLSLVKPALSTPFPPCWAGTTLRRSSFISYFSQTTYSCVFECSRSFPRIPSLDPGLPDLGMMISQTRVTDTGVDVKD